MSEADLREEAVSPSPLSTFSEERKRELLALWRDVLSGKVKPEVLPITPEVEAAVRAEEKKRGRPFLKLSRQRLLDDYALSWHHGGKPVVCLETPAGCAVLASGAAEMLFFEASIPSQQRLRVRIDYPGFWEEEMTK